MTPGCSKSAIAKSPKQTNAISVRPIACRVGTTPSEQRVAALKSAVGASDPRDTDGNGSSLANEAGQALSEIRSVSQQLAELMVGRRVLLRVHKEEARPEAPEDFSAPLKLLERLHARLREHRHALVEHVANRNALDHHSRYLLPFLRPNAYNCTRCLQSSSCFIRDCLQNKVLHRVHRHLTARRSHYRAGAHTKRFITNIARGV